MQPLVLVTGRRKRKIVVGVVLLVLAVVFTTLTLRAVNTGRFFSSATTELTAQNAGVGVPTFELDPSWLKVPEKWKLANVTSVAVDAQDHIWLLTRPRETKPLPAGSKAVISPPVLEFDAAGNFLQAWGGPGDGYDWPQREHSIRVDHKDNVWITGNYCPARNTPGFRRAWDDQLLKFSKAGKLILQIGRSNPHANRGTGNYTNADTENLHGPTEVFVYPKTNEVFVADGYYNHRVIVFDADTGAFKRMWGAFGNKPLDADRCPPVDPAPVPNDGSPGPQQWEIVHALIVSNDGLVYVADRETKRLQVFTIDGQYMRQVFIGRDRPDAIRTTAGLALSPDPQQQFLYVGGQFSREIVVLDRKTLEILDSFGGTGPHQIAADSKGNIYTAEQANGAHKFVFKGLRSAPSR